MGGSPLRSVEEKVNWMQGEYERGLVSVVVPTFNRAHLIVQTLDSVRAQTYRPIEVIVVDDGSSDDTAEIIEAWKNRCASEDLRVSFFSQTNQGAQVARNRGLVESRGEYVQFVDSDDLLMPQKLERSVSVLTTTGAAYAVENYVEFDDETGEILETTDLTRRDKTPHAHLVSNALHTIAPVFRRHVVKTVGPWSEGLDIWQDTEYMFRVLASEYRGIWTKEMGAHVRETVGSISNRRVANVWPRMLQWSEHIERVASELDVDSVPVRKSIATMLATVSRRLAMEGDWQASGTVFQAAMCRMPWSRRWRHVIHRVAMRTVGCDLLHRFGAM